MLLMVIKKFFEFIICINNWEYIVMFFFFFIDIVFLLVYLKVMLNLISRSCIYFFMLFVVLYIGCRLVMMCVDVEC